MSQIFFPMLISSMSHIDFKKWPCCPVNFKGQGPQHTVLLKNFLLQFGRKCNDTLKICNDHFEEQGLNLYLVLVLSLATLLLP